MWTMCGSSLLTTQTTFRWAPDSLNGALGRLQLPCFCYHTSSILEVFVMFPIVFQQSSGSYIVSINHSSTQ